MRRWAGVLAAALLCSGAGLAATAAAGPVDDLAGRYGQSRVMGVTQREQVDDVVEIVPVAPDAAYVRFRLFFGNLHSCSLHGVARAEGGGLVYREPLPPIGDRSCTLTIRRAGHQLRLSDEGGSCQSRCGAAGSLRDVRLPWSSRRAISYVDRLRASPQYREALQEWRTGQRVRP